MDIASLGLRPASGFETKPQSIQQAAEAFEALLVGQMLKSAREARGTEGLDGESNSNPMMDLADEHMAQQISRGGGCGLAKAVMQQLKRG